MCGKFQTPLRIVRVRELFTGKNVISVLYTYINYFASPEIIQVEICNRQTDRQTDSLTLYTGGRGFFLSVKFATSLLASLAGDKFRFQIS